VNTAKPRDRTGMSHVRMLGLTRDRTGMSHAGMLGLTRHRTGMSHAGMLGLTRDRTDAGYAGSWPRSRRARNWTNSRPSRRRRAAIWGLRAISADISAILEARK
jgi:hypothetical protein